MEPQIWKFPEDLSAQEGKINQKPLMKKEPGMVVAFAFSAGQELKEHTAPFDVLVTIQSGQAGITMNAKTMSLAQGSCVMLPANVPHSVRAETEMHMTLTLIRA